MIPLLMQAQQAWMGLAAFREERDRNKRYHFGDQWGDIVQVEGHWMREEDMIRQQGSIALKNNLIRRLVRNVIGVYTSQMSDLRCTVHNAKKEEYGAIMGELLKYNNDRNRLTAINTRSLEEFLISGMVVHRKWYGWRNGVKDCWTDFVPPQNFFVNGNMRDFRGWDCTLVGQVHDVPLQQVCQNFASSEQECKKIEEIYGQAMDANSIYADWQPFGCPQPPNMNFLAPCDPNLCRVIEVWRKEAVNQYLCHDRMEGSLFYIPEDQYSHIKTINRARQKQGKPLVFTQWRVADVWRYYYLTPWGQILAQGDSPYEHGEHPYVMKAYPMIDGEIHAFVSDVIDQQRYTNRLITLYDWIVRSSAKGVLMVPEDCIPRGCSPHQFAEQWSKFNGVLVYRPNVNGDIPKQVACNSTNIGITELLNLQMKLFEDISGVHGALEGKLQNSTMSGTLYTQQTQNATTALTDILGTFNEFVRDGAYKSMRLIKQFYSSNRIKDIVGESRIAIENDSSEMSFKDIEFDIAIKPCKPNTHEENKALLMEFWRAGEISFDQLLSAGNFDLKLPDESKPAKKKTNKNTKK